MTEEQIALAKRAVACKCWRFMGGMRVLLSPDIVGRVLDDGSAVYDGTPGYRIAVGELPDLTDPATLGCLLALVREAWEPRRGTDHIASTVHTSTGWGVGARVGSECFAAIILPAFASEAAALVAALEAAP